jgi:hypothetical protein
MSSRHVESQSLDCECVPGARCRAYISLASGTAPWAICPLYPLIPVSSTFLCGNLPHTRNEINIHVAFRHKFYKSENLSSRTAVIQRFTWCRVAPYKGSGVISGRNPSRNRCGPPRRGTAAAAPAKRFSDMRTQPRQSRATIYSDTIGAVVGPAEIFRTYGTSYSPRPAAVAARMFSDVSTRDAQPAAMARRPRWHGGRDGTAATARPL